MEETKKIKLGLPAGLLKSQTVKLFLAAGYEIKLNEPFYTAYIDDPEIEIFLARDKELAFYAEKGAVDAAIAQSAFLLETRAKVEPIQMLDYGVNIWGKAKIILAVPEEPEIKTAKDLEGKKVLTRLPNLARQYFKERGVKVNLEWTDRPSEPKIPLLGDAIVDFTNTGQTLKAFNLKVIDVLMETSPTLFMNREAYKDEWKRRKIEDLGILLKGARLGQEWSGLMLHAQNKIMEQVLSFLPALKKPTVTQLRGEDWFDVLSVVKKEDLRILIPELKKIGCRDIVEFPLDKVVP